MSPSVMKDKKAHIRRLSSGKKVRVIAHRQRYNLKGRELRIVNKTKRELAQIRKEVKTSRQNKRLFVARYKAAQEIMALRGSNDIWKDLHENNDPVGFITDDKRWNDWLESLGKSGDIINIDTTNVVRGQTIPEPWWQWTKSSKKGKYERTSLLYKLKKKRPDKKYDSWQLKVGTKIEMEHTNDPIIAEIIVKDHLDIHSDYYYHLVQLENRLATRDPKFRDFRSNLGFV